MIVIQSTLILLNSFWFVFYIPYCTCNRRKLLANIGTMCVTCVRGMEWILLWPWSRLFSSIGSTEASRCQGGWLDLPGLGSFNTVTCVLLSIVGSLRDREVACSASDRQGSNFEFCVWRTVSSHSSHHPQEVLLAQFSLYVHEGGLKPDAFHVVTCVLIAEPLHIGVTRWNSCTIWTPTTDLPPQNTDFNPKLHESLYCLDIPTL